MGGGGFSALNPTPNFDRWFVGLAGKDRPRLGYLPTAGGDDETRIEAFSGCAERAGAEPVPIRLFHPESRDVGGLIASCDAVWVGGGNTFNLIQLWRAWGVDWALWHAMQREVPLGGVSAGANCWFEQCSTDSFGLQLDVTEGLGWLAGSFTPHYDSEELRRPTLAGFLAEGRINGGWACDEGVALVWEDERLTGAVRANGSGAAYRVDVGVHERIEPSDV